MHPLSPALLIAGAASSPSIRADRTGIQFVNHAGFKSHFDHASKTSSWPLPRAASCDALAEYAKSMGILVDEPAEGDVFLLYSRTFGRFDRAGIIAGVDVEFTWRGKSVFLCTTIEDGVSRGRTLSPTTGDRFIRWADLEWRRHAA